MSENEPAEPHHERPRAPRRIQLGIGSALIIVLVLVSASIGVNLLRNMATPVQHIGPVTALDAHVAEQADAARIYVHVAGQVVDPGLYRLAADARVVDAIAAAGGTSDDADLQSINLARAVSDGEQLIVPAVGDAAIEAMQSGIASDGKVNINTADAVTLATLPRVGPALAQRIIEWREANGAFRTVDDLLGVSGIGEKMLAGLRDRVTL